MKTLLVLAANQELADSLQAGLNPARLRVVSRTTVEDVDSVFSLPRMPRFVVVVVVSSFTTGLGTTSTLVDRSYVISVDSVVAACAIPPKVMPPIVIAIILERTLVFIK